MTPASVLDEVMVRWFSRAIFAAIVVVLLCPALLRAQASVETFTRQLEQIQRDTVLRIDPDMSVDQRAIIDYGGYFQFGYLSADDNVNQNHVLRQYELYGYARVNIDGAHEFFIRGVGGWRDYNDGDSFDDRGDERIDPELDRWFYRFDLARYRAAYYGQKIDYNLVVKAGRDLTIWGNGLVLSEDLVGGDVLFTWAGNELNVIAGVTPTRTVDFDASRPNFDHNTNRGFYGAMLTRDVQGHRPYVYGLIQQDYNSDDTLTTGPVTTEFEYNSWYIGIGASGPIGDRIVYGVEAVYEGGDTESNSFVTGGPFLTPVPQTNDGIEAWALDARIDYLIPDQRRSRLSGEVIVASGDDDRLNTSNTFGGNQPGTKDHAFNAFGLLNTGLAFAPAVSNLIAFRIGGSSFPLPDSGPLRRMQIGTDIFAYYKYDADAPIDELTFEHGYLGWEPDLYMNWQVTSDVTLTVRYGVFFPDSEAFPSDDARQYIYGGMTYAF